MNDVQAVIKHPSNHILFYGSLVGILILSCISYFLSYIASGTSEINTAYMGYFVMAQYSVMGLFMLIAWKTSPKSSRLVDYKVLLSVAIVARLLLFAVQPYTSNDVDRYLFDGRIVVEGLDPYRVSHDTPVLQALREQWQPPAEHAKYVTIYPPVALAFFSLAASAGINGAVIVWKLILFCASLLTLWLTVRVLQKLGKLKNLALVALSPLLILETGVGLHLDALSTLAIIAAIYYWQRNKIIVSGFVIGLGMLTKVLPIMLLLPLIFTQKNLLNAFKLLITTALTVIGVYILMLILGFHPVGSISVFFEKWRFAAPIFVLLDQFLSGEQIVVTLFITATMLCSFTVYICWRNRETLAQNTLLIVGIMQVMVALPLILSPVVFPWYLMPLVPLLTLYPNRYLIFWTLLTPLTYEVIGQFTCCQIWQPALWPVWLIGLLQFATIIALLRYCIRQWARLNNKSACYV
jgi:hypothetical protein